MTTLRRRGAWSTITNISDRDVAISLLRSAGHGNVIDRNVDLILSSKVIIDMHGNVLELTLGKKDQSNTRFQQQQRPRQRRRRRPAEGNGTTGDGNDDDNLYWDLSASVGKLTKLSKLVLCRCRSLPETLHKLPELKCLEFHFCDGNTMLQRQEALYSSIQRIGSLGVSDSPYSHFVHLRTLEIHGGIWNAQSLLWMKSATALDVVTSIENNQEQPTEETQRISQLEVVRFSFLTNDLRSAILDFLSPFKIGGAIMNACVRGREMESRTARICGLSDSKLKHLAWVHSGMTEQGLELLLREVVLPYHRNLSSIDVSGNQIRSLQFLLELPNENETTGGSYSNENEHFQWYQRHDQIFYYPLRTLNLQHNPVLKYRISNHREVEALEFLLKHWFPLLGSLTPSWENWDSRIEYLLRINRGGRALVEGNGMPPPFRASPKPTSNDCDSSWKREWMATIDSTVLTRRIEEREFARTFMKKKLHLSVWPLVLHRAYRTSSKGFLPPLEDATALYYLIRNGPPLSEIFASATK
jgi:hypothetical protein